jgi:hypothetical protein
MASKKDLGGLAALAGMAYLASRDKAKSGEDAGAEDTGATASPVGSGSAEETKLDSMADIPRVRATPKPVARPMGGSGRGGRGGATADELASYANSKKPAYETPYDRSRREDREAGRDIGSVVESLKNKLTSEDTRKPLPLKSTKSETGNAFMGAGMKKGGKVKKMASGGGVKGWGIARGSRKAKTY